MTERIHASDKKLFLTFLKKILIPLYVIIIVLEMSLRKKKSFNYGSISTLIISERIGLYSWSDLFLLMGLCS